MFIRFFIFSRIKFKLMTYFNKTWTILKDTYKDWSARDLGSEAASLAYNAIFSIPGLLIMVIWFAGIFFGEEAVRGEITKFIGGMLGQNAGESIEDMIVSGMVDKKNIVMKTVGVLTLVFGATTIFFQLQKTLNKLWDVVSEPKKAWQKYILDRASSLGMILVIAFLLLITLLVSSFIGMANDWIAAKFGIETVWLMNIINGVIGFLISYAIFAAMFKILPDLELEWRSVWTGAFVTALLFTAGKYILTYYFNTFKPTSSFGAAGTIILLMLWVNYTCQIIFFGAEFTKVYAKAHGHKLLLSKHAKWAPQIVQDDGKAADIVEGAESSTAETDSSKTTQDTMI